MGRRQARLTDRGSTRASWWLRASLLAVAVLGAAPWGGAASAQESPASSGAAGKRAEVRARIVEATASARDGLAALGVAHGSMVRTADRLRPRLTDMAERAEQGGVPLLQARAAALLGELELLQGRSDNVLQRVADLTLRVNLAEVELIQNLDAEPAPRLQVLVDAEVSAGALETEVEILEASSDVLVSDLAMLNASVEDVHRSLQAALGTAQDAAPVALEAPVVDLSHVPVAELRTNRGTLVLAFRPDVAPRTVENFFKLARQGFYDGLSFHRIIPGFLAQGGCPNGDGSGGPGWTVPAEFNDLPHRRGTLSMARFGHPDSAGSQFFLCLDDWSGELDHKYTVFGRLIGGNDVLDELASLGTESGEPLEPVEILEVSLRPRGRGEPGAETPIDNPGR